MFGVRFMKRVLIFILCAMSLALAQSPSIAEPAPREHRGFYNSSSFGFALNWFDNSMEKIDKYGNKVDRDVDFYEYFGTTFMLGEFKFGSASGDGYNIRTYLGFGATFYPFRDKNSPLYGAFVGGSVGSTLFVMAGSGNNGNGGVGFELEMGKEWWLNDRLSIGFGLGFAHFGLVWSTVASHRSDNVLSLSFRLTRG